MSTLKISRSGSRRSALDTLPHQGAQITLLNLCHLTHREGYLDIAVTQIVIPILALFVVIPLCSMGL